MKAFIDPPYRATNPNSVADSLPAPLSTARYDEWGTKTHVHGRITAARKQAVEIYKKRKEKAAKLAQKPIDTAKDFLERQAAKKRAQNERLLKMRDACDPRAFDRTDGGAVAGFFYRPRTLRTFESGV